MIHGKFGWLGYCDVPAIVIYVVGFDEMAKFCAFPRVYRVEQD